MKSFLSLICWFQWTGQVCIYRSAVMPDSSCKWLTAVKKRSEGFSGSLLCKWCRALGLGYAASWDYFWLAVCASTHWHTALGASRVTGGYGTASFPPSTLARLACSPKQGKKLQIPGLKLWNVFGVCLVVTSWTFSLLAVQSTAITTVENTTK